MTEILIIDPDRAYSRLVSDALASIGTVQQVRTAQAAIDYLDSPKALPNLIIIELFLGVRSGIEVIHEIRSYADWLGIPVILHSRSRLAAELQQADLFDDYGIEGYIQKGSDSLRKLMATVSETVKA